MLHRHPEQPARLRRVSRQSPQQLPVGYTPLVPRDAAAPAGPDGPERQEAMYSPPRYSWSKLSGSIEFDINLFIVHIDGVEAICTKLMEKLHPSKPSHGGG